MIIWCLCGCLFISDVFLCLLDFYLFFSAVVYLYFSPHLIHTPSHSFFIIPIPLSSFTKSFLTFAPLISPLICLYPNTRSCCIPPIETTRSDLLLFLDATPQRYLSLRNLSSPFAPPFLPSLCLRRLPSPALNLLPELSIPARLIQTQVDPRYKIPARNAQAHTRCPVTREPS